MRGMSDHNVPPAASAAPATSGSPNPSGRRFESGSVPRFEPPCGPVVGWNDGAVVRATGIPYAEAERFERPRPVPDRGAGDVLGATQWSHASPQPYNAFLEQVLGATPDRHPSEHCQQLSVTMPADLARGETVPVMVWIHGGSYANGAGDLPVMDPAALVAEQRVIVVTVTYRLGILGFLGDGTDERPANLGLLDMLEAFRWVRRNIASFGGDPARVTAFGQSAGADAVAHLLAVPEASSLFSRAIIQSAPLGLARGRARMTSLMAEAAAEVTPETPVDKVVALSAKLQRIAAPFGLKGGMPFSTQYGFDPLPAEREIERAWNEAAPRVDVLIGHTSEEGRLFVPNLPKLKPWVALPVVGPVIQKAIVGLATWLVYGRTDARFARRHARAGGRVHSYVVSWKAPGNPFGAAHMIDLPLLFGDEVAWRDAALVAGATRQEIDANGTILRQLWGDFARGDALRARGRVPGLITYRRVG
jgi:para-nitrobenzyl esterase